MSIQLLKSVGMTFLIAMTPVVELRGAIPAGVIAGLGVRTALFVSILGNLVPAPFIIIFIRKIFKWGKKKSITLNRLVEKFEKKADAKKDQVLKYEFFGLMVLVAIPLPGTGVWTGSLVAAMLDMQLKRALPAITVGVIIAGIVVSFATYGISSIL